MKKNVKVKRGFTLVELLIAITILGIIMVIAIPALTSINRKDIETQERIYEESLITAAKMYNDSYSEDTFGRNKYGCSKIPYSKLKDKDLIKKLESNQLECAYSEEGKDSSGLIVRKVGNKYYYEAILWCKNKNNNNKEEHVSGNIREKFWKIGDTYCNESATEDDEPPVVYYTNNNIRYFYNESNKPKPYVWIYDSVSGLKSPVSVYVDWVDLNTSSNNKKTINTYKPGNFNNLRPQAISLLEPMKASDVNGQYKLTISSHKVQDMAGKVLADGTLAVAQDPTSRPSGVSQIKHVDSPEIFYIENTNPVVTTTDSQGWTNKKITVSLGVTDEVAGKVYSGIESFKYTVKNTSPTPNETINDKSDCGEVSTEAGISKNASGKELPQNSAQKEKSCSFVIGEGNYGDGAYTLETTAIDWAGNKTIKSNTYKYDHTPPTVSITRKSYNQYNWTASDTGYSLLNGYVNDKSASDPTSGWKAASESGTVTIDTATTYYTHVKDTAGNTAKASIQAFTVTRSQGTGTTLTTKYETASGTAFTAASSVALNGTKIYIEAALKPGYENLKIKYKGTEISNKTTSTLSSDAKIETTATACAAGKYNDGTSGTCMQCPSGYTSDAGAKAQTECYINVDAVKYKTSATGATTAACSAGYYKDAHKSYYNSSDSCTQCPAGYRDGAATSVITSCKKSVTCGNYVGTKNGGTTQCAAGTYKEAHTVNYGSTSSCTSCGSGKTSPKGSCQSSACVNACSSLSATTGWVDCPGCISGYNGYCGFWFSGCTDGLSGHMCYYNPYGDTWCGTGDTSSTGSTGYGYAWFYSNSEWRYYRYTEGVKAVATNKNGNSVTKICST